MQGPVPEVDQAILFLLYPSYGEDIVQISPINLLEAIEFDELSTFDILFSTKVLAFSSVFKIIFSIL